MNRNLIVAWSTMILANIHAIEGNTIAFVVFMILSCVSLYFDYKERYSGNE